MRYVFRGFCAFSVLLSLLGLLLGCSNGSGTQNADMGKIIGGITGAYIGSEVTKGDSRFVGTAAGALIGSYIGEQIGSSIDKENRQKMGWVLENQRSNSAVKWVDPDTNQVYEMVPQKSYHSKKRVCRPFKLVMHIDGKKYYQKGVACRRRDGTWELIS